MNSIGKCTIYFDLSAQEAWATKEWEALLARIDRSDSAFELSSRPEGADFHLLTTSPTIYGAWKCLRDRRKDMSNVFVWDSSDFPAGINRGLYCSLKHRLYDSRRHRSFIYPIVYNECVDYFDPADATYSWCFFGGITSPVRRRLLEALEPLKSQSHGYIKVQSGPWNAMFDRSGVAAKVEFAEAMRRTKFVICPRGNGVGSIRLFETMKAGRVPIIVADAYVPPEGIDWKTCAIRVPERDIRRIPEIVSRKLADWQSMASAARSAWEKHFSDDVMLTEIGHLLTQINTHTQPKVMPIVAEDALQSAKKSYLDVRRALITRRGNNRAA